MRTPTNAAAVEIMRRREINADIDEQIRVLRNTQMENSEIIGNISNVATWLEPLESPPAAPEAGEEPPGAPDTPAGEENPVEPILEDSTELTEENENE